jgi:hypothetical protein
MVGIAGLRDKAEMNTTDQTFAVRQEGFGLEPRDLLTRGVGVLLGVAQPAVAALKRLRIVTVADLAASAVFDASRQICLLVDHDVGRFAGGSHVPPDVLRVDVGMDDLPRQPISVLATGVSSDDMSHLATALGVASVRELSVWPPYITALAVLEAVNPLFVDAEESYSPPADLVPSNGRYPTERIQYEHLLFGEYLDGEETPLDLATAGPLDVGSLLATELGYRRPAIGAILTFTQSWYTEGVALGNLIHSVALGPGESTRIAMVDWSRRNRSAATEEIAETEALSAGLVAARGITEITTAVAHETQTGRSTANNFATATQQGRSTGSAGIAAPFPFGPISPAVVTEGTTSSTAISNSTATAWSTSSGSRDVSASMAQNIMDSTQQASHVARSRRASIVREVSQEESESISTRALTNYNHMHALTIEYYEVVQLYRAAVELSQHDRCVFVPLSIIDFTNPIVIQRHQRTIALHGLTSEVRALALAEPSRLALWSPGRTSPWRTDQLDALENLYGADVGDAGSEVLGFPMRFRFDDVYFPRNVPFSALIVTLSSGQQERFRLEVEEGEAGGPLINTLHVHPDDQPRARQRFGTLLADVRTVEAEWSDDVGDFAGDVVVSFFEDNAMMDGPYFLLALSVSAPTERPRVTLFNVLPTISSEALTDHLVEHRLHYSQAVWGALDATTIGAILSTFGMRVAPDDDVRPLVRLVDPTPASISANYLVFRITNDDPDSKREWMRAHGIMPRTVREDLVPVPTGGLFAEAVLGRANAGEKLDMTRFWNWQDSPIPIVASEIAPIAAGSRSEPDDTVPGQLGAPILNIMNAPAMPDPQGLSSALAAVQNGNMFRDMSGLAATIGLAQAGMAAAQQGAIAAGEQAGQNAQVAAELGAKVAELAAKAVAAYFTGGASLAAGGAGGLAGLAGGISGQGARINQGKAMDDRARTNSNNGGLPSTSTPQASGAGSSDGATSSTSSPPLNGSGSGSNEAAAFEASMGVGGAGGPLGQMLAQVLGQTVGSGGSARVPIATDTGGPGSRSGVALGQLGILGGGSSDPHSLRTHSYGASGIWPADGMGLVYTAHAGLVDLGHVRDNIDMVKWVHDRLVAGDTRFMTFEGDVTVHRIPRDAVSRLDVAAGITFVEGLAHELSTWNTPTQDFSSFSPEDLPSNLIGIECGVRAIAAGGSFNTAATSALDSILNGELAARLPADTDAVLAAVEGAGKWYQRGRLYRRNFQGIPWMAGMPYDAPLTLPWMAPTRFRPLYGEFAFTMLRPVAGIVSPVTLSTMESTIATIRAAYVAAHPGWDGP